MKLIIGPIFSEFECDDRYAASLAVDVSRFRKKGYRFTKAYENGWWDGWVNLHKKLDGDCEGYVLPTGFVPRLLYLLARDNLFCEIEDRRERPSPCVSPRKGELEGIVLRDYQRQMVDSLATEELIGESFFELSGEISDFLFSGVGQKTPYRLPGMGIWWSATGCHASDAQIMLFDGSIKKVQEIVVGDVLMGPGRSPRQVLSLIRGRGEMFRIIPESGDSFVVNKDHVLSLVDISTDKVVDVSLRRWLEWDNEKRGLYKLFRSPVAAGTKGGSFPKKDLSSFSASYVEVGSYYGFTLDGDGRYLMGDFTVTHNSGKTECAAALIGRLAVPTLFLVYGQSLVKQTFDRFRRRFGRWLFDNNIEMGLTLEGNLDLRFITVASSSTISAALRGPRLVQERGISILDLLEGKRSDDDKSHVKDLLRMVKLKKRIKGDAAKFLAKYEVLRDRGGEPLDSLAKMLLPETIFSVDEGLSRDDLDSYESWIRSIRSAVGRHNMKRMRKLLVEFQERPYAERISYYYGSWITSLRTYPDRLEAAVEKRGRVEEYLGGVKLIILDEAHGGASDTIVEIMEKCPAYFRCGMSGTPLDRSDNENLKIIGYFGDVVSRVTNSQMRKQGVIPPASVIVAKIGGELDIARDVSFSEIEKKGIVYYSPRNYKVIRHIQEAYEQGLKTFVLVRRREHGELLSRLLWCEPDTAGEDTFIPHDLLDGEPIEHGRVDGRDSQDVREEVVRKFRAGIIKVVIATGIFRTGLDVPEIEMIIRADGGEGKIPVKQGAGRTLRGDKPVIIRDYADGHHPVLARHSLSRVRTYHAEECFDIKFERE